MMTIFRRLPVLAGIFLASSAAAEANGFEQVDLLEARIIATLGAGLGEPGGPAAPIDRRLKLAACREAPEIAVPTPASAIVRCAPAGWRIYVPLTRRMAATLAPAQEQQPVIRRGDQVEVVATGPGFTVSTFAQAEQEGTAGDRIRVRIKPGLAPVIAQVLESGRVSVAEFN